MNPNRPAFMSMEQLRSYLGVHKDELTAQLEADGFPRPVRAFGQERWSIAEIDEWMADLPRVRDGAAMKRYAKLRRRQRQRGRIKASWDLPFFGIR